MPFLEQPLQVTVYTEDISQNRAKSLFWLPSSALSADAAAYTTMLATAMETISDGIVVEYRLTYTFNRVPSVPPGNTSNNRRVGVWICETTTTGDRWLFVLPSLRENLLTIAPDPMAGITIDTSDPDVQAVTNALVSGLNGVQPISNLTLADIVQLNTAYRQYR